MGLISGMLHAAEMRAANAPLIDPTNMRDKELVERYGSMLSGLGQAAAAGFYPEIAGPKIERQIKLLEEEILRRMRGLQGRRAKDPLGF
jgi:hypothetical protein